MLLVTVLRHHQVPRVELASTVAYRSHQLSSSANGGIGTDTASITTSAAANTATTTTTMPMSSLLYAVSLAVHQPILSAIGSYDLGNDIDFKSLGTFGDYITSFRL